MDCAKLTSPLAASSSTNASLSSRSRERRLSRALSLSLSWDDFRRSVHTLFHVLRQDDHHLPIIHLALPVALRKTSHNRTPASCSEEAIRLDPFGTGKWAEIIWAMLRVCRAVSRSTEETAVWNGQFTSIAREGHPDKVNTGLPLTNEGRLKTARTICLDLSRWVIENGESALIGSCGGIERSKHGTFMM